MSNNVILDDKYHKKHNATIVYFWKKYPQLMQRKIQEANIQQAWMYDTIASLAESDSSMLCVGCHEDTAYYALKDNYGNVVGIDPIINYDLATYKANQNKKFDVVFSTSVIEHVDDDESFIADMCDLLNPGGYGVITCDFNDDYPNVPKPTVDFRLYTMHDLTVRIPTILKSKGCTVVGDFDYHNRVDFQYEGCTYGFATLIFTRPSDVV